jgi:methionyl aminopeptidase
MTTEPPAKRKCIGVNCENDAGTLQCPTCLKLGLKESFFCSQDCFKRSWSDHKSVHKAQTNLLSSLITPKVVSQPDPETGVYDPFPAFSYTGPLRAAYPLSKPRKVPKSIPYPDYAETGYPKSERLERRNNIQILDKKQQAGMRKVCRLAREVLDIAAAAAKPGVTTDYIDEIVHRACIEREVSNYCFMCWS